ncbi:MAG: PDZ domain-containing protein [Anaerolineales bacterium]|nr:PDZ domain-containing protein [Anaerolineales bacterium]
MNRYSLLRLSLRLPLGGSVLAFNLTWLAGVAAGLWAIGALYIPIVAAFLTPLETWTLALVTGFLTLVCLIGHVAGHQWAARAVGSELPPTIPLYPIGDAAQDWPVAPTAWREALAALAGPLVSLGLAGLAYLLWNVQLHAYLNTVSLFLILFNAGIAALNLVPFLPLDGGRLMRAIMWGLLARPAFWARVERRWGVIAVAALSGWGVFLMSQQVRFSAATGAGTLLLAGLIGVMLLAHPGRQWTPSEPAAPSRWSMIFIRLPLAVLLSGSLLGLTLLLTPTNNGLEAPGIAPPVEPMVVVPSAYRQPVKGSFLLTTVFSQTPITAGQWLLGLVSPAIRLVPPEQIVPPDTTMQEVAQRNYRMLDDSQTAAAAVGLRLAGYEVDTHGLGARVLSLLPESLANGLLQPGDVIVGVNGVAVEAVSALTTQLARQPRQSQVRLQIERDGEPLEITTPLMPSPEPDQPPRIGISVEDVGFDINLPFPVEITPQKIIGGPSAGLMFTLTVYNLVTPEDLTGGRIIAGTGTINLDGSVGPIGGVQQKVVGAELAGAEYFLSPPENYDDAAAMARRLKVVKVATAQEAIEFLRSLR